MCKHLLFSYPLSVYEHPYASPPCLCAHRQQELSNLLQEKKYLKALGLAISLDQPHTVLTVIRGI